MKFIFPKLSMNFNSFDVNLFNKLCESSDGNKNIFFSPMSISLALSMLLVGSDGTTKQQLEKALGVVKNGDLLKNLKALNDVLSCNSEALKIKLANSVFPSKNFQMISKFKSDAKYALKCAVKTLDYKKNAEKSKTIINDWVASCTDGKINELFSEFDPETACVLVSCIYFKGDWLHQFKSRSTRDAPFYCNKKKTSQVRMMIQQNRFGYRAVRAKKFKCLKIPYKEQDYSMVIILPNNRFGLNDVIKKLTIKTIESLKDDKEYRETLVTLEMPKFKIEYEASLNEKLRLLDIKDAFDEENADFSAMSKDALKYDDARLHVSEVVHKAFIETSEEGTEAAAATGIAWKLPRKAAPKSIDFTVDHPFVFMILCKDQTLFMGKVTSF